MDTQSKMADSGWGRSRLVREQVVFSRKIHTEVTDGTVDSFSLKLVSIASEPLSGNRNGHD